MPRASRYSPAEKAQILASARQMLATGAKRKDVAAHLGINIDSLSGWLREQTLNRLLPPVEPSASPRAQRT